MKTVSLSPFSARNRRERNWIEEDFPASARNGVLHLLSAAIEKEHLRNWIVVARELRRIARVDPVECDESSRENRRQARYDVQALLDQLAWDKLYDFCERLYSNLTEDIVGWKNNEEIIFTKAESQSFFAEELQRLFEEENLGYEFRDGIVQRRGRQHTNSQTTKAQGALADQRLEAARVHFSKALRYFHDRKKADHENTVKEAVCAVEAAAKQLFPDASAKTLGDFVGWAAHSERLFPKTIAQTFTGLYAFRNSGEGVAHGGASGGSVTPELSEYVLGTAASQIVFLIDLARNNEEPPF